MAQNMIFNDIPSTRRVCKVGKNVAPGSAVEANGVGGVALTGSGDYVPKNTLGDGTVVPGVTNRGGVGLDDEFATVAFSGSFAFDIEGAKADTAPGTKVFVGKDGKAALTGTTQLGVVEFFRGETSSTDTVVTVGVHAPAGA